MAVKRKTSLINKSHWHIRYVCVCVQRWFSMVVVGNRSYSSPTWRNNKNIFVTFNLIFFMFSRDFHGLARTSYTFTMHAFYSRTHTHTQSTIEWKPNRPSASRPSLNALSLEYLLNYKHHTKGRVRTINDPKRSITTRQVVKRSEARLMLMRKV